VCIYTVYIQRPEVTFTPRRIGLLLISWRSVDFIDGHIIELYYYNYYNYCLLIFFILLPSVVKIPIAKDYYFIVITLTEITNEVTLRCNAELKGQYKRPRLEYDDNTIIFVYLSVPRSIYRWIWMEYSYV